MYKALGSDPLNIVASGHPLRACLAASEAQVLNKMEMGRAEGVSVKPVVVPGTWSARAPLWRDYKPGYKWKLSIKRKRMGWGADQTKVVQPCYLGDSRAPPSTHPGWR